MNKMSNISKNGMHVLGSKFPLLSNRKSYRYAPLNLPSIKEAWSKQEHLPEETDLVYLSQHTRAERLSSPQSGDKE